MKTEFIVMTSCARVLSMRPYRNVAVLEVEPGAAPKMISERARGVVRIIAHYGPQNVGKTKRCAYERTLAKAKNLADTMAANQK